MNQKESPSQQSAGQLKKTAEARLFDKITDLLLPLGYDLIHMETHLQKTKILRLFIDFSFSETQQPASEGISEQKIGIEDCVKVSRLLEEPLEQIEEVAIIFPSEYELEVSSPGLDRPLRKRIDFDRFKGRKVKIHTYRALTADDLKNTEYARQNPKQKNFIGVLLGSIGLPELENSSQSEESKWLVRLDCNPLLLNPSQKRKKGQKPPQKAAKKVSERDNTLSEVIYQICIPNELISQARIEPDLDFEGSGEPETILTGDI